MCVVRVRCRMNTGFRIMLPRKMVSPLPLHILSRESCSGVQKYSSSNSRNPDFPLWPVALSCHLLPNSKYTSENTDCLHGLIVFVASEGLVFHSASTFIPSFFNTAQFLRLQKQFCILRRRHVLPRGISHQLIPKQSISWFSSNHNPKTSHLHQPHPP